MRHLRKLGIAVALAACQASAAAITWDGSEAPDLNWSNWWPTGLRPRASHS